MCRKRKKAVITDFKKSWRRIEAERGVEQGGARLKLSVVEFHRKKESLAFGQIERKTLVFRPAI